MDIKVLTEAIFFLHDLQNEVAWSVSWEKLPNLPSRGRRMEQKGLSCVSRFMSQFIIATISKV